MLSTRLWLKPALTRRHAVGGLAAIGGSLALAMVSLATSTGPSTLASRLAELGAWWERPSHDHIQKPIGSDAPQAACLDPRLAEALASALAAAGQESTTWEADPGRALLDASVFAGPKGRSLLLSSIPEWIELAPVCHASLLRTGLRLLEPSLPETGSLVVEEGAGGRVNAMAAEWIAELETVTPQRAPIFLDRLERRRSALRIGGVLPELAARDLAGNVFCPSEYRGSICVLRVWDSERPASVAAHRRDQELIRAFWDAPFELIGISSDEDREAHLRFVRAEGFEGTQLFDGPISDTLANHLAIESDDLDRLGGSPEVSDALPALGYPHPGTVLVLDDRGTIRARDIEPDAVRATVRSLIAERRQGLRERFNLHADGPSGGQGLSR